MKNILSSFGQFPVQSVDSVHVTRITSNLEGQEVEIMTLSPVVATAMYGHMLSDKKPSGETLTECVDLRSIFTSHQVTEKQR